MSGPAPHVISRMGTDFDKLRSLFITQSATRNDDGSITLILNDCDGKSFLLTVTEDYPHGDICFFCAQTADSERMRGTLMEVATALHNRYHSAPSPNNNTTSRVPPAAAAAGSTNTNTSGAYNHTEFGFHRCAAEDAARDMKQYAASELPDFIKELEKLPDKDTAADVKGPLAAARWQRAQCLGFGPVLEALVKIETDKPNAKRNLPKVRALSVLGRSIVAETLKLVSRTNGARRTLCHNAFLAPSMSTGMKVCCTLGAAAAGAAGVWVAAAVASKCGAQVGCAAGPTGAAVGAVAGAIVGFIYAYYYADSAAGATRRDLDAGLASKLESATADEIDQVRVLLLRVFAVAGAPSFCTQAKCGICGDCKTDICAMCLCEMPRCSHALDDLQSGKVQHDALCAIRAYRCQHAICHGCLQESLQDPCMQRCPSCRADRL